MLRNNSINRTMVELKCVNVNENTFGTPSINRTMVELKYKNKLPCFAINIFY